MNDFFEFIWKVVNENYGIVMLKWVEFLSIIDDFFIFLNCNIKVMLIYWEIIKENNGN